MITGTIYNDSEWLGDFPLHTRGGHDGRQPGHPRVAPTEFREPGQVFHVTDTTTFRWFSVDSAGNIEKNYDPTKSDKRGNYRAATITIAKK
ncbi:hypothetical protein LUPAC06_03271 [Micromonospora saelicesensis]|uniref:hypothetical protein n=1 Tax=Micromonospora saelicesensis TaxID=285676 RepID=UPI000DBFE2AF|nr:hypothetical protein [Micromonospora saelicesensis]RAO57083.1 hypothetical protein LUPAC06_03271 [Micromonospora saelicesensis]